MIKPSIHRNGTSADTLLDSYVVAGQKIRDALEALDDATPNARDYYVQGDGAFDAAMAEHRKRINCLRGVLADMQALAEHCADGVQ